MVLAAASNPADGAGPLPTLNILIDDTTLTTHLTGNDHDPGRYAAMVCRTQDGEWLPIAEASSAALFAHLRRVVLDRAGVVIDLGRRSRLFTGAAREAVMLTHSTCVWFGCDAPIRRTHADHAVEWARRSGTTSPDNGEPLCAAHNLLKERRRYRIHREPDGQFTITAHDGSPLG
ncbi:MAG: HNH endonuclease signature motif containing protein [Actinomycetota bacterium]